MAVTSQPFTVADRYQVGDIIGRGGMGEVRRARDLRLDRDVAIKFLRADLAAQPAARQRFEEEARNAARLSHPNTVLVFDSGEHEGRPYLVMECLPGHSLRDELGAGPLSEARATWIAADVLAALAAAHDVGVVHRDVSPSNILLTDTDRAKLADFGISKAAETSEVTTAGLVLGTPGYLAPERMRGEPATPATDVYSLGVTLRRGLDGAAIGTAFAALLDRMTAEDPQQRPTAAAALAALDGSAVVEPETAIVPAVATAAVGAPAMTVATPAVAPVSATWWRERWALIVTVAAVGLLGLLLLLATDTDPHAEELQPTATTAATAPPTTVTTLPPPTTIAVDIVIPSRNRDRDGDRDGAKDPGKAKRGRRD